jgi:ferrous iron transport protein B
MLVINMADLLKARSGFIDPMEVGESLGVPVALVSASNGSGIEQIVHFITPSR